MTKRQSSSLLIDGRFQAADEAGRMTDFRVVSGHSMRVPSVRFLPLGDSIATSFMDALGLHFLLPFELDG